MNKRRPLDQTDQLILYLVVHLTKGVPHLLVEKGGVLTTMLAKLLFLVDVWSIQTTGLQATTFRYIRYKYGPYPLAQFEKRLEELKSWGLYALPKTSLVDGRAYRIYRLSEEPKTRFALPPSTKLLADEVMTTFATQRLEDVLAHVYSMDFVRSTPFGHEIDLRSLSPREGDFVTSIIASFKGDLMAAISAEHLSALEQAHKETTNENIKLAQAMIGKQRKAFRQKEGP